MSQIPAEITPHILKLNGIDLYYERLGEGEPLLLLHGGGGSHADWVHAGRDELAGEFSLIMPDARGHGRSTNPVRTITHRQCALDTLALLDHLGISKCKAIGLSMGGNILLHMATLQPERIQAMIVVGSTMFFPEQARAIMRKAPVENQTPAEWESMRKRHYHGDEQVSAIWQWLRGMADSYDDMNFTPPLLSKITASTLIVYGDRDFLYPIEMAVDMYRAIPKSSLWVVPNGNHGPTFLEQAPPFIKAALTFLRA